MTEAQQLAADTAGALIQSLSTFPLVPSGRAPNAKSVRFALVEVADIAYDPIFLIITPFTT